MKKIMFNDALGLTQAVLEGRKTQTRRVATYEDIKCLNDGWALEGKDKGKRVLCKGEQVVAMAAYAKGEVVAIAQSYEDILKEMVGENADKMTFNNLFYETHSRAGWRNKMFVKADEMPHRIRITDIKIERLQDISVKDCLEEGIEEVTIHEDMVGDATAYRFHGSENYTTVKKAYHALIDELDKKMWERNPFVFVYEFELMD